MYMHTLHTHEHDNYSKQVVVIFVNQVRNEQGEVGLESEISAQMELSDSLDVTSDSTRCVSTNIASTSAEYFSIQHSQAFKEPASFEICVITSFLSFKGDPRFRFLFIAES